jgi:threonine/homoserine/homoserine lactone efflux protein
LLTQPTRGRLALWSVLTLAWIAFLPESLVPGHKHFSWAAAILWTVVLVWLLVCLALTWRNYRRAARRGPPGS